MSAANDYYVYDPTDLDGYITVGGGLQIVDNYKLDNGKLYVSIELTKTGTSNNNTTVITINPMGFASDVKAKDYPVVKISYRSNVAVNAQLTANIGIDYNKNASPVAAKLFTPFKYYDRTFATSYFIYNLKTDCSTGEIMNTDPIERISAFSADRDLSSTSGFNFIYIKPYVSNLNMVKGEHFDIEYVGFFKTVADAEAYVHTVDLSSIPLTDITLREQVMRITKDDTFQLTVMAKPSFVPLGSNIQYTSSNKNVATVDATGKVTAISAGTATITAKSGQLESTCKVYVFDKDIASLELYYKSENKTSYIVNSLGDSITTYVPSPEGGKQYHYYWAQWYNITNNNYGVSGTTVNPRSGRTNSFLERYSSMRDDAGLITVKGGTNDWGGSFATGSMSDREPTTYIGGIRILMEGLIEKYPDKQIVFFSPIKRSGDKVNNSKGSSLLDCTNALIELGKIYDIPVIDIYTPEELDFTSAIITPSGKDEHGVWHDAVCESDLMPDGLHPSGKGQKIMAEYMMEEMIKLGVFNDNTPADAGDVDGDEQISSVDWVILARSLAGWGGYNVNKNAADVNKDGVSDSLDTIILARHIAKWKGYESLPLE